MSDVDVVIIGGGVVGCALLYTLSSNSSARVLLVEKGAHLLLGASSGNSGIDHTGFDAARNTLESACLEMSNSLKPDVYRQLGVDRIEGGAVMVAWKQHELELLDELVSNSSLTRLTPAQLNRLEPNISPHSLGAALIEGEAVVEPWLLPVKMADSSISNGAEVRLRCEVTSANWNEHSRKWRLEMNGGSSTDITCNVVVNCGGLFGDDVNVLLGDQIGEKFRIRPRKGQFVVFSKSARHLIKHIILPVPQTHTKGIIIFPTVHGNIVVGPTAEDVDDKLSTTPDPQATQHILSQAYEILPQLRGYAVVREYVGLRPAIQGANKDYILRCDEARNCITIAGIRSTGLSSCLGIAKYVQDQFLPKFTKQTSCLSSSRCEECNYKADVTRDGWMMLGGGNTSRYYKITHPITQCGLCTSREEPVSSKL